MMSWSRTTRGVMALAVGLFVAVMAFVQRGDVGRSERIQHGTQVAALVERSWTTIQRSKWGDYHDTEYQVSFTNPDGGQQIHTVVERSRFNDPHAAGRIINVVFDPAHPTNAEVPGHPASTRGTRWAVELLGAGLAVFGASSLLASHNRR